MKNNKLEPLKCYWYCVTGDWFLFIFPNGDILDKKFGWLIKEKYRNKPYFRIPNSNKRLAQSTIKRKAERCNVLINNN